MKTFEQYIKEAVDFRLGGSQQKGYDKAKTFAELKEGDEFFYISCDISRTEMFAMRIYKLVKKIVSGKILLCYSNNIYDYISIGEYDLDSSLKSDEAYNGHVEIVSTSMEEALEKLNSIWNKPWKEKDFEQY